MSIVPPARSTRVGAEDLINTQVIRCPFDDILVIESLMSDKLQLVVTARQTKVRRTSDYLSFKSLRNCFLTLRRLPLLRFLGAVS